MLLNPRSLLVVRLVSTEAAFDQEQGMVVAVQGCVGNWSSVGGSE